MRVSNLTVSTLLPLLAIASTAQANENSSSPETNLDGNDGAADSQATSPIAVTPVPVAIAPPAPAPSPEFIQTEFPQTQFTQSEVRAEPIIADAAIDPPRAEFTQPEAVVDSGVTEFALAESLSESVVEAGVTEPAIATPTLESSTLEVDPLEPESVGSGASGISPQPVTAVSPLPTAQTEAVVLVTPEIAQSDTAQPETVQPGIMPDFVNLTVAATDAVTGSITNAAVASEHQLNSPHPTPTAPPHQPEFADEAIVAAQPSAIEPDWAGFSEAEMPVAAHSHGTSASSTCEAKLHPKLLIGEPAAAIAHQAATQYIMAQQGGANSCYEPEAVEPVAAPKARKYIASPALSIYIPVGYGADRNTAFVSTNYQSAVRPDANGSTFNGGLGVGLGNASESVGVELSYALANNDAFGEGGFNVKVHRRLQDDWAVAAGWNGLLNIGRNDFEHSKYGVVTKVVRLSPSLDDPLSRLSITAGVGDNQFRSNGAARAGDNNINVFGNMALRVARPVSLIAEWTGQDVGLGLSIAPFKHVPLTLTPAVRDLITTDGRSTRFVLGVGTAFRF